MIHNLDIQQALYPDAEVIYWNELFQRNIKRAIVPLMLKDDGIAYASKVRKQGDTLQTLPTIKIVIFNYDYVVTKLSSELNPIIQDLPLDEFLDLFQAAYNHGK